MTKTFTYSFDELPLVISNGIQAAFINGAAEISYSADGSWNVEGISLEGFGERVNGKRQWPMVPAPADLAGIILRRIECEWQNRVQDAINEQIAEDRESAADSAADYRRDRMMEDAR